MKKRILRHQSGSLGLFPLNPFGNNQTQGHVRVNVYCAQVVWALALAYRYIQYGVMFLCISYISTNIYLILMVSCCLYSYSGVNFKHYNLFSF